MKILLVNTNRCRSPFPVLPAGACLVADAARGAGHRVTFLDLMFAREPMHALAAKIEEARPDVVGLSVRNIDNNDMLNPGEFVTELRALADAIRRRSDAPIVLGGPALPIMPEALLRHTGARCAVLGDGERVFPRLVERLGRGDTNGAVGDVAWLDGDRFRRARANGRGGFGAFRVPNLRRWVDLRPYISRYSPVPVRTKLGCRFECIHCTYPAIEGKAYRLADPEAVAEGVGSLVSCGLRDIEFVDNVFNYPYDQACAPSDGGTPPPLRG
jgi:radical SAM superfamily enzyme YgiQ (UPF0313 family)